MHGTGTNYTLNYYLSRQQCVKLGNTSDGYLSTNVQRRGPHGTDIMQYAFKLYNYFR